MQYNLLEVNRVCDITAKNFHVFYSIFNSPTDIMKTLKLHDEATFAVRIKGIVYLETVSIRFSISYDIQFVLFTVFEWIYQLYSHLRELTMLKRFRF